MVDGAKVFEASVGPFFGEPAALRRGAAGLNFGQSLALAGGGAEGVEERSEITALTDVGEVAAQVDDEFLLEVGVGLLPRHDFDAEGEVSRRSRSHALLSAAVVLEDAVGGDGESKRELHVGVDVVEPAAGGDVQPQLVDASPDVLVLGVRLHDGGGWSGVVEAEGERGASVVAEPRILMELIALVVERGPVDAKGEVSESSTAGPVEPLVVLVWDVEVAVGGEIVAVPGVRNDSIVAGIDGGVGFIHALGVVRVDVELARLPRVFGVLQACRVGEDDGEQDVELEVLVDGQLELEVELVDYALIAQLFVDEDGVFVLTPIGTASAVGLASNLCLLIGLLEGGFDMEIEQIFNDLAIIDVFVCGVDDIRDLGGLYARTDEQQARQDGQPASSVKTSCHSAAS